MSGLIPREFIDNLVNQVDIVELIDSYVPLKKRGSQFIACCPFHNEKTPSFNVTPVKQLYYCFGCGAGGNVVSFVMAHRNLDFIDAVEELASRVGLEVPRENQPQNNSNYSISRNYYTLLQDVSKYFQQQLSNPNSVDARKYLAARGLSSKIIEQYQVGFAPRGWDNVLNKFHASQEFLLDTGMVIENDNKRLYDRYRERIMFPIADRRGRIVGFGGRVIDQEQQPKYLNSPETAIFHKSRELYGLYQAVQNNKDLDYVLIVEGYTDVLALAESGLTQVVATLGTASSKEHLQHLSRYTKCIIFCFDGDDAGRSAAWKALDNSLSQISGDLEFKFMFLPENEDPDSLVKKEGLAEFKQRINQSISLIDLLFAKLTKGLDLSQVSSRSQLIERAKPFFVMLPYNSYRQLMLNELANKARIEVDRLENLLKEKLSNASFAIEHKKQVKVPSNLRLVLSLLVQNPELISVVPKDFHFVENISSGGELLINVIGLLSSRKIITTAQVLEHYRHHKSFEIVVKLSLLSHHIPEEGIEEEFLGSLNLLQQHNLESEISSLLGKASAGGLSDAERTKLQKMIKERKLSRDNI